MAGAKKLVIGASGFLGSHVTRQLGDRGDDVRVLIRRTSSTKAIEDLSERVTSSTTTATSSTTPHCVPPWSVRLMHSWPRLDQGKAESALGCQPKPIHDSIRRATLFSRQQLRSRRSATG